MRAKAAGSWKAYVYRAIRAVALFSARMVVVVRERGEGEGKMGQ